METASAQSAASATVKLQSLSPSPQIAQPYPDRPSMAMTTAELEAAIAALPAKKDALREAFDRLAACSPFPLPFTWDDLDAHISSLQSSISLRYRQLRVLEAARPAPAVSAAAATGKDGKGKNHEEDEDEVEEEQQANEEAEEEKQEAEVEEQEANDEAEEEEQEVDVEMQEAKEEAAKKASLVQDEEENGEGQEEEMGEAHEDQQHEAKKVSPEQDIEEEEEEEEEENGEAQEEEMWEAQEDQQQEAKKASPEQDIEEEEEENREAKKVSLEQGNPGLSDGGKDLMAAFASMDVTRLVKLVYKSVGIREEFPLVMRHAANAAALVLCVVRSFLHNKEPKTIRGWGNCVGLIRCVPAVTPKLSVLMMEHANRLAKDWKEMIDKPDSCGDLGVLASWGLLYFLISYNIVSEFDANEIIHLFSAIPRKHKKKNVVELCKGLGLVGRITDLIDYLIGNGQQLDAVQLTHVFNLVDKYPPLSILEGYVEKAKETALEIFNKKVSPKSLNPVISMEVDNLRVAQNMVEKQSTSQCSVIFAEIKNLLAEYAKKRDQIKASTVSTSNSQQQQKTQQKQQQQKQKTHDKQQKQKQKNKKRKNVQQEHEGQESQQQEQQSKLQGKQEQQQTKPQEKHQQQKQNKLQENQGQQQHEPQKKLQQHQQQNEPQERQQQHLKRPRPCINKLPTPVIRASGVLPPVVPNVAQIGPFGHSPYAVMPGFHTYPRIQGGPFAPNVGAPQYMGPSNPYQLNPLYRHPSFYPR